MANTRELDTRPFFDRPLRARMFIVGLAGFYGGIPVTYVASGAGHPAEPVVVALFTMAFGLLAMLCLPLFLFTPGHLRERCALLSQLREAADVAGWSRRLVLSVLLGLLAVDVACLLLLPIVGPP